MPTTSPTKIIVRYSTIDRFSERRTFTTLAGARKFAHHYVGPHPDMGRFYAVSFDGVGKIVVEGATLAELFPDECAALPEDEGSTGARLTPAEWNARYDGECPF